jgi:diguanylate cyclase
MLTAFLFFGNLVRMKYLVSKHSSKKMSQYVIGTFLGFLGVILMYFSFPIHDKWITDFRQLPILVSACLTGFPGGIITSIIIFVYRLFFFPNGLIVSLAAFINIIVALVVGILMLNRSRFELWRWGVALSVSILSTSVVFSLISKDFTAEIIIIYESVFLLSGLFMRSMLQYLKRSDEHLWLMQEHAERDFLTGLYNSRAFDGLMKKTITNAIEEKSYFSVLMLDIDHFKRVNDTHGHPAGDKVLTSLANILKKQFNIDDLIARKGGEEFIVIMNRYTSTEAKDIAEQLRQAVEKYNFILPDGQLIHITISIGIACYPQISSDKLIDMADQSLYLAKQSGRNCVRMFSDLYVREKVML